MIIKPTMSGVAFIVRLESFSDHPRNILASQTLCLAILYTWKDLNVLILCVLYLLLNTN